MKPLILASNSPRRKELLMQARLTFSVVASTIEEQVDRSLPPEQVVQRLALEKANDVFSRHQDAVVIGADTVVVSDGEILGKPLHRMDAKETLRLLSEQTHSVFTGVAIVSANGYVAFAEETKVTFWPLTDEEIDAYLDTGEPFDKAGSYGIQGLGALFVKEIAGDYFNVVGLPLSKTVRELRNVGILSVMTKM